MSIKKELREIIFEKINNKKRTIIGHAVSSPKLKTFFGEQTWVVDVLIGEDKELLKDVPIAESNRNVANSVTDNVPVEIKRSNGGQFYVTGRANIKRGEVKTKTFDPLNMLFGLGYTQGWRRKASNPNEFETGNENDIDSGTETTTIERYEFELIPYDELIPYGSLPYGAKRAIRIVEIT